MGDLENYKAWLKTLSDNELFAEGYLTEAWLKVCQQDQHEVQAQYRAEQEQEARDDV